MTRKKTGFRCKENGEENWLGATRAGERDGVESVAISLVELKPKLHRTGICSCELQAAVNEPRKEMRKRSRRIRRRKKDQMGQLLDNAFGSKLFSLSVPSRRCRINFRHKVNANISETPNCANGKTRCWNRMQMFCSFSSEKRRCSTMNVVW